MKNKKGFTLVELLAVIVILALIMGIAVVSIGGVLKSSRESTFKETALSIINGVKMQLTVANQLKEGKYYFKNTLLDNDNELPFGGQINYGTWAATAETVPGTNGVIYRAGNYDESCTATTNSFVSIKNELEKYIFYICLTPVDATSTSSKKYLKGKEADLYGSSVQTVFDTVGSTPTPTP